ncbi:MAG: plastoquinol terminal oxidase [Proteobacteria bacterium]|nr:plastoquinol terminal oxidase [Pseudomonadota bacterium]
MKKLNDTILTVTIAIIDFLYRDLPIQRFWVLETIARAPYFAFLSVLHLRESLGLRTDSHYYLMKEHFAQTVNETEHLIEMESRGGSNRWIDRFFAYHLVIIYYWILVVYYSIAPISAYHLNTGIEYHATETYLSYLWEHPEDTKIAEIAVDEMNHYIELTRAMEMI